MSIVNTPVMREIHEIFGNAPKPVNHVWRCKVILPHKEYFPRKILELDINRDYVQNFSDEVSITITLPDGDYNNDFVRYKDNITFELTRHPIKEREEISHEDEILVKRYKAILLDNRNDIVSASRTNSQDPETDNLNDFNPRKFQLIDEALEPLRVLETGGIYRDTIPGKVVRYVLTLAVSKIDVPTESKIVGVDMVNSDNQNPNNHIILPHGTKVYEVPTVIQEDWGGVYNSGIGSYLQDKLWYIWPQYRTNRYHEEERVLRIYNLPSTMLPGVERTYRLNGKELIVISTGEGVFLDVSYEEKLNLGNGVRYTSAEKIMSGFDTKENTDNNVYKVTRGDNNTEIKGNLWNDDDYAPVSPKRITDNLFYETSRLSKRQGSYVSVVWENSKIDLVYPGMPLKFFYIEKNEIKELKGVLVRAHHYIHDTSYGSEQTKHITNTNLTVFVERLSEWQR